MLLPDLTYLLLYSSCRAYYWGPGLAARLGDLQTVFMPAGVALNTAALIFARTALVAGGVDDTAFHTLPVGHVAAGVFIAERDDLCVSHGATFPPALAAFVVLRAVGAVLPDAVHRTVLLLHLGASAVLHLPHTVAGVPKTTGVTVFAAVVGFVPVMLVNYINISNVFKVFKHDFIPSLPG